MARIVCPFFIGYNRLSFPSASKLVQAMLLECEQAFCRKPKLVGQVTAQACPACASPHDRRCIVARNTVYIYDCNGSLSIFDARRRHSISPFPTSPRFKKAWMLETCVLASTSVRYCRRDLSCLMANQPELELDVSPPDSRLSSLVTRDCGVRHAVWWLCAEKRSNKNK